MWLISGAQTLIKLLTPPMLNVSHRLSGLGAVGAVLGVQGRVSAWGAVRAVLYSYAKR
jgi:hypothetical protein